ncbi:MAG: response regulator [Elusimicrobia bacterium]|nr:response regulator [Elusimicrobiota bacterium]
MKILCVNSKWKHDNSKLGVKKGYEFVKVRAGDGLFEVIEKESPDLILLHISKLCSGISDLKKQYPKIPLLVISGDRKIKKKIDCLEQGADSYVHSSVIAEKLFMLIKALIRSYEWGEMRH